MCTQAVVHVNSSPYMQPHPLMRREEVVLWYGARRVAEEVPAILHSILH